jgi:hypothetical protein
MNSTYRIEIEAKTHSGIPRDKVDCMLGGEFLAPTCKSILHADWVVTSEDKIVASGSTENQYCCGNTYSNGVIGEQIGILHIEKGREYILDMDISQDASALSAADPHLTLIESGDKAESSGLIEELMLIPCGPVSVVGIAFIVISLIQLRRAKRQGAPQID